MALHNFIHQTISNVPVMDKSCEVGDVYLGLHRSMIDKFNLHEGQQVTVHFSSGAQYTTYIEVVDNEDWEEDEELGCIFHCCLTYPMTSLANRAVIDKVTITVWQIAVLDREDSEDEKQSAFTIRQHGLKA